MRYVSTFPLSRLSPVIDHIKFYSDTADLITSYNEDMNLTLEFLDYYINDPETILDHYSESEIEILSSIIDTLLGKSITYGHRTKFYVNYRYSLFIIITEK